MRAVLALALRTTEFLFYHLLLTLVDRVSRLPREAPMPEAMRLYRENIALKAQLDVLAQHIARSEKKPRHTVADHRPFVPETGAESATKGARWPPTAAATGSPNDAFALCGRTSASRSAAESAGRPLPRRATRRRDGRPEDAKRPRGARAGAAGISACA